MTDQKSFATLQAKAALAGIVLAQTQDAQGQPIFVANRWSLSKTFDRLEDVSTWLGRVTGKAPDMPAATFERIASDLGSGERPTA